MERIQRYISSEVKFLRCFHLHDLASIYNTFKLLDFLSSSDIKDIHGNSGDIKHIQISDSEFEEITDRKHFIAIEEDALVTEG